MSLLDDIYYKSDYIALYLNKGDSIFEFEYKEFKSYFYNISIKRPINKIGDQPIEEGFYDLETAYGYGGFLTNSEDKAFIGRAMTAYRSYCLEERIIAEFIRFNPLNSFPLKHSQALDFNLHDRDTVITSGNGYIEVSKNYKSSLSRNIRKAKEHGLEFQEVTGNKHQYVDIFYNLYVKTMDKNKAKDFYYFDKLYFDKLFHHSSCMLFFIKHKGNIINIVLILAGSRCWYYHLGATAPEYYHLNTNAYIFDEITRLACEKSIPVYFGGGTSCSEGDPLLAFKQKFSPIKIPFHIAGNIYNHAVYNRYNHIFDKQNQTNLRYFLKYRLNLGNI